MVIGLNLVLNRDMGCKASKQQTSKSTERCAEMDDIFLYVHVNHPCAYWYAIINQ